MDVQFRFFGSLVIVLLCHYSAQNGQVQDGNSSSPSYFLLGHPTGVAIQAWSQKQISDKGDKVTDILHLLLTKYDSRIRPFHPDNPVVVSVSALQFQVSDIIETKSEISSSVLLQQVWFDPRLAFETEDPGNTVPYIIISHEHTREIWLPDTSFVNEVKAQVHDATMTNDAVVLYRNGTVARSMRITVSTTCLFKYEDFPFDSQKCEISVGSNAFRVNDVKYVWDEKYLINTQTTSVNSHTGSFLMTDISLTEGPQTFNHGKLSRVSLQVTLQRAWRQFITRFYIPMVLFVFVSLGSLFFADPRIGLIVNLFNLAFVNIFIGIRGSSGDSPNAGARTALDTYFVISMTYIVIVILATIQKLAGSNRDNNNTLEDGGRSWNGHHSHGSRANFDGSGNDDIFSPSQEDSESVHHHHQEERRNSDRQRIYLSPTYPVTYASKTRVVFRKICKLLDWLQVNLRWILIPSFLVTDYIYFKIHAL